MEECHLGLDANEHVVEGAILAGLEKDVSSVIY